MTVTFIIIGVGLFFLVAILLAIGVMSAQSRAKRQAKAMLDAGEINPKTVKQALKVLSAVDDNEGKRLYNRLADLAEGRHSPTVISEQFQDTQTPGAHEEAPPAGKDKVSRRIRVFVGIASAAAVGLVIYIATAYGGDSTPQSTPLPSITKVVYEITGTANSVSITLSNATGGTEQYGNAKVPQSITYSDFKSSFLYISAQNNGERGSVTVTIYVNGRAVKTATSSGAYVIATASGSLW